MKGWKDHASSTKLLVQMGIVVTALFIGGCDLQTRRVDKGITNGAAPTADNSEYLRVSSWQIKPEMLGDERELIMLKLLNSSQESLLIPVDPIVLRYSEKDSSNVDFLTAEFFGVDVVALRGKGHYINPMSEFFPPLQHYSITIVELPPGDSALVGIPLGQIVDPPYRTSKPVNVRIVIAFFTTGSVDTSLLSVESIGNSKSCIDTSWFTRTKDYSSFMAVDVNQWVRQEQGHFRRKWCVPNYLVQNEIDRTELLRAYTYIALNLME